MSNPAHRMSRRAAPFDQRHGPVPVSVDPELPLDDAALRLYLADAAASLRALPLATRRARLSSWPPVVRDTVSLLAPVPGARNRLAAPAPAAIDRMDEVLSWLLACTVEERRILWARACRVPWRKLEDLDGRSHTTLRAVAAQGLERIRRHLRERRAGLTGTERERRVARGLRTLVAGNKSEKNSLHRF